MILMMWWTLGILYLCISVVVAALRLQIEMKAVCLEKPTASSELLSTDGDEFRKVVVGFTSNRQVLFFSIR